MTCARPEKKAAVIGASPMMMLVAINRADAGYEVTLFSDQQTRGGAWRTALANGTEEVEIACHVIEPFPGVYEFLAQQSGSDFIDLDLQPVRIHRTGLTIQYASRVTLGLSLLRMAMMYTVYGVMKFLGISNVDHEFANYRTKLRSALRHQRRYFFRKTQMQGPVDGYVSFVNGLINRCRAAGVEFVDLKVENLQSSDGKWRVTTGSGASWEVNSVHCSSSVALESQKPNVYSVASAAIQSRSSVVVDVQTNDIIKKHSYAAFWRDDRVRRISRIDNPNVPDGRVRYLVEMCERYDSVDEQLESIVKRSLQKAKVVPIDSSIELIGIVDCDTSMPAFQMPPGKIEDGLFSYYSFGNLAAGIAEILPHLKNTASSCRSGGLSVESIH